MAYAERAADAGPDAIEMTKPTVETQELAGAGVFGSGVGPPPPAAAGLPAQEQFFYAGGEIAELDAATEKRILRKFDRVILPIVFALYLVSFLDRSNIGNAETAGMGTDLGFGNDKYQWLLTIFYIPYILFEWFAFMWKVVPPHVWAFITVFTWGVASTMQAAAFSWQGLMVARWFLAMAEAGFGPGMPYMLSFFYRRHEIGFRIGMFISAAPLATTFAGALAFGITSGYPSIPNWRVLFLVEGLPTVALAIIVFFCLPDSPDAVRSLTPEERQVARTRAILQSGQESKDRLGSINFREVLAAFQSPQTLIQPLMYFSCNVSFASLPVFLPAILTDMGYSSIDAQGMTAPPYFLSFLVCLATTYIADRTRQRGLIIIILSIVGGIGYVLLAAVKSVSVRYLGVFLASAGVFPAIANILPWVINNQGTDSKRGLAITMLNAIGQCGPLLGTRIFPSSDGPYYVKGMSICAAFMFFNALLTLVLRTYFVLENRRLEREENEAVTTAAAAAGGGAAAGEAPEKSPFPAGLSEVEGSFGYRYIL